MEERRWSNVKVFHTGRFDEIEHVATVQVDRREWSSEFDALDYAFMRTNSIDGLWFDPAPQSVIPSEKAAQGCRSSSVGDIFVIDNGATYAVQRIGWRRLN